MRTPEGTLENFELSVAGNRVSSEVSRLASQCGERAQLLDSSRSALAQLRIEKVDWAGEDVLARRQVLV